MDAFMGTILLWAMNWAPNGWEICDGRLLPINQYTALFSLLGTAYGGDGKTNFALPDLRGRVPVGMGQGPGLTPRNLGERFGWESAVITLNNLPEHSHTMTASGTPPDTLADVPAAGWTLGSPGVNNGGRPVTYTPVQIYGGESPSAPVHSAPSSVSGSPSPAGIPTVPPALALNFIICVNGLYPPRA